MNIFKQISLYMDFRRKVRRNRKKLLEDFNIKVDLAYRLYTVVNVPDRMGEPYNLRTVDLNRESELHIKEYIRKLSVFLDSIGLSEMYGYYSPTKKLGKYSYLLVIGFKHMNSVKLNNIFWFIIAPVILFLLFLVTPFVLDSLVYFSKLL